MTDPDDERRRAGLTFALWLLITFAIWAAVVASCLAQGGCGSVPDARHPLPIVVVSAIPGPRFECPGIWEIPRAPDMPPIPGSDEVPDVIDRVYVHARTYAEMVEFAHDLADWAQVVKACLQKLSGQDAP